jgi:hypothetical protein
MSLRDEILKSSDRKIERVETPEWSCGHVHVRSLSAKEHMEYSQTATKFREDDEKSLAALMAVYYVCDEQGNQVFQEGDIPALMEKNSQVLQRIVQAGTKLLLPEAVKELEKNS